MDVIFYVLALVAIISTGLTIIQKNAVYALLYLIIALLSISGIFFSLGAFFAGALEVIIYAGAIIVLFVFIIMMLNIDDKNNLKEEYCLKPIFWIGPIIVSLMLLFFMTDALFFLKEKQISRLFMDSKIVGLSLFGPYALLVELSSMLLLSALVVVFHIGTNNINKKKSL